MWPDHFHCVNHGQKKDYLKPGDILIDDDKRHSSGMHPDAYFIHHVAEYERDGGSIVMIKEPDVEATIKEIEKVYS